MSPQFSACGASSEVCGWEGGTGVLQQQRHGMKMGPGGGVPHHPSGAVCDCLELALTSFPGKQESFVQKGEISGEEGLCDRH